MTPIPGSNAPGSNALGSNVPHTPLGAVAPPAVGSSPSGTLGQGSGHDKSDSGQHSVASSQQGDLVRDSLLYKEFVAERDEILRHKWIESEKAGHDIGFEKALLDWVLRYRSAWRLQRSGGGGIAGGR
jgi:hypothetical protein